MGKKKEEDVEIPETFKKLYDVTNVTRVTKNKDTGIYTIYTADGEKVKFDESKIKLNEMIKKDVMRDTYTLRQDGKWRTTVGLELNPTKEEMEYIEFKAKESKLSIRNYLSLLLTYSLQKEMEVKT